MVVFAGNRYILVYTSMMDMITHVYTTIYKLYYYILTCTKHAKYIVVYTSIYVFQYKSVYTCIY